jgi:hypothetical protein
LANLRLVIMRQRDPAGKKLPTDDLEVVARSTGAAIRLLHNPNDSTYEVVAEFEAAANGHYAIRVEGQAPTTRRPGELSDPTKPQLEIRPRILVESLDASSRGKGRVVFQDFAGDPIWPRANVGAAPVPELQYGGVGMPADARSVVTVGAADGAGKVKFYSSVGAGPGRELLVKPDVLSYDSFDLGRGTRAAGSWIAAAFDGGLAACAIGANVPAEAGPFLRTLDARPGSVLKIPASWLK